MIRFLDVVAVWGLRLAVVLAAPLLLLFARTWRARAVGVFLLSAFVATASLAVMDLTFTTAVVVVGPGVPPEPPPPLGLPRWPFEWAFLLSLLLLPFACLWATIAVLFLILSLPAYRSDTAGVRSIFLGPTYLFRWQMAVLDEQDWLRLAVQLGTRLDFRISRKEARAIRERAGILLEELREAPDFRDIPPAWPLAVWGKVFRPDHGHLLVYRPNTGGPPVPQVPQEKCGLLVFLHGHGGNSLLFPHLLREFADAHRLVVVCPSFGYGNWEHPDSPRCVERVVNYAVEHFAEIDPRRVYLAGLSQGGAGVERAAVVMPDTFAGLIFLSATMEPTVLAGEAFAGRRVLVIQGEKDRHVTPASVGKGVEALRSAGADVTVHRDPIGTHFLFFAQTDEVLRQVGEWFTPSSLPRSTPAPG